MRCGLWAPARAGRAGGLRGRSRHVGKFSADKYTYGTSRPALTVNKAGSGGGTVTCDGGACAASYTEGGSVMLAASAALGAEFTGWSGDGCSGIGSCTVTLDADTTVTATFEKQSSPSPPAGMAKAASTAQVSGNKVEVELSCSGGACSGSLELSVKLRQGRKTKMLVIGGESFRIAAGKSKTIKVKITNGQVKKLLKEGKTVKMIVSGTGIKSGNVKLKPSKAKGKR